VAEPRLKEGREKDRIRSHRMIFWDRPELRNKSAADFCSYLEELRQKGRRAELLRIVKRFVQWGNATEGMILFSEGEIKEALEQLKRSSRSLQFCDPVRFRAWEKAAKYARKYWGR